jgi:hypothetical protein
MYALSLPTIAQVSPVARFRGKQPIWWTAARPRGRDTIAAGTARAW